MQVVGTIDPGVKAAEWSPDGSLLILITGEDGLLKMTQDFDVLSEAPLRPSEFGQGTH